MSVQAMGEVWEQSKYSGDVQVILLAIADVVNDTHGNEFWAGRARLAEKANVSERTVSRALASLVADGWLTKLADPRRGQPARYQFHPPEMGRQSDTPLDELGCHERSDGVSNQVSTPITNSKNSTGEPDGSFDVSHETPQATRTRAGRALNAAKRRTTPEAQTVAGEVWENLDPRPLLRGGFPALRGLVDAALKAGWTADEIKAVAPQIDSWASWSLSQALRQHRRRHGAGSYNPDAGS